MAVTALSPSRALHRPRRADRRAILGIFLLLAAIGGSLAFWSSSSATTSILIAAHDLPAGAKLAASDLTAARVHADDATYGAAVPASDLAGVVGRQLRSPLYAHQMLVRPQLAAGLALGRDQVVFTIPASPDTAAGGRIQPGDAVEVLVTTGKGTTTPQSTVVLPSARVYDVGYSEAMTTINTTSSTDTAGSSTRGPISWLTLVVSQSQALQLARAKWAGQLDVALRPDQ